MRLIEISIFLRGGDHSNMESLNYLEFRSTIFRKRNNRVNVRPIAKLHGASFQALGSGAIEGGSHQWLSMAFSV